MSQNTSGYWKGPEERDQTPEFRKAADREFPEALDVETLISNQAGWSRRSFLKAAGFTAAASLAASCAREPVEKAIPLLVQDETTVPGKSYWYASTCGGCSAGCGILARTRDGRPIKMEGNPDHPLSRGGLCAVGQAMTLDLYDSKRLSAPVIDGQPVEWTEVDRRIVDELSGVQSGVYILTGTLTSLSTRETIRRFLSRYTDSGHVEFDASGYSAILDSHEMTHGKRLLPHYRFDRAETIISVEADFLGTWISPVEFTRDYTRGRSLEGEEPRLSYHVQFEGRLSLTGTCADRRVRTTPRESVASLRRLAERIANRSGQPIGALDRFPASTGMDEAFLDETADRLWDARGKSLVVCGINDVGAQTLVNAINHILENYGATVDLQTPSYQWTGNDRAMQTLLDSMRNGQVNALIIEGVNPAYSLPDSGFAEALARVPLTVSLSRYMDETSSLTRYTGAASHALETWDDAEPVAGLISVSQPALPLLGKTRTLRHCLSQWMGEPVDDLALVQNYWMDRIYPRRKQDLSFQNFWDQSVHDGYALVSTPDVSPPAFTMPSRWPVSETPEAEIGALFLVLYEKVGMRDGRHAHNPWLHELPDPVTKAVWDSYVCLSPAAATALDIAEGDVVTVASEGYSVELPALIQPGQHERVAAIAVGYGRMGTDRFSGVGPDWISAEKTVETGETVGKNGYGFMILKNGARGGVNTVTLRATGRRVALAVTQTHHTITVPEHLGGERRNMIRETTLAAYRLDPASGNTEHHDNIQLWADDYPYTGHHWGMVIDLNRCSGCSACVIACQAENNVPVVGRDEVYRRREMSWIRIDRYYSGDGNDVDVMHQPVMCQHCNHAPCEGVCPVLATVHSDEGLNQQIYNRCVGTRYCANNCPYKVRRFNWFDYWKVDQMENLALNPDLTTRTRGVMEKCSLCVQRIQEAKAEAKIKGVPVDDRNIRTACQQSCPAEAIVFGDMNNPESPVARLINTPRHYRMLEEMNFRPAVGYLTRVRNRV